MKKVLLIAIVLVVGGFFAFFDVNFDGNNQLTFLEDYRAETGYVDYTAERVYSTSSSESGLRFTFSGCSIDTTNMDLFGEVSERMAVQINQALNEDDEYNYILVIFKPSDPNGIRLNDLMTIEELKFRYQTGDLQENL